VSITFAGNMDEKKDVEWIRFRRNRFSTRLPSHYRYSLSHYWFDEYRPGVWRIGMTGFATRMLGEIVEFDFEVQDGQPVKVGDEIGWIEGFKAISDIYCAANGDFRGVNDAVVADTSIVCARSYDDGWLYQVEGAPETGSVDVDGYIRHLELTIDKMLEKPWKKPEVSEG